MPVHVMYILITVHIEFLQGTKLSTELNHCQCRKLTAHMSENEKKDLIHTNIHVCI